jgi:hypothetical protein
MPNEHNTCTVAEKFCIMAVLKKINYAVHKETRDNADEKVRGKLV